MAKKKSAREQQDQISKTYNEDWNTHWNVETPRKDLPRRIARHLRSLGELLMLGQPVMGYTPVSDQKLITQSRTHTAFGVAAGLSNVNLGNINYRQTTRNGGASKESWGRHWGPLPFHHILDPTGAYAGWTVIFQDLVLIAFTSGNSWEFFGSFSFNMANDETSLVGVGWRTNNTDGYWTSTLRDGTGTPSTVVHETALTAVTSTVKRRLSTVLNAETKSVEWYADGVLVDSYTPTVALSEMTNCPNFGYFGITATGAEGRFRHFGGGNPRVLTLVPVS